MSTVRLPAETYKTIYLNDFDITLDNTHHRIYFRDIDITDWLEEYYNLIYNATNLIESNELFNPVKDVFFNYEKGATTVNWIDGTYTYVKCCPGDEFDEEKGIALCFMKKFFNNKQRYNNMMKKYITNAKTYGEIEKKDLVKFDNKSGRWTFMVTEESADN